MKSVYQIRLKYEDQTDPHVADIDANDILLPKEERRFFDEVLGTTKRVETSVVRTEPEIPAT